MSPRSRVFVHRRGSLLFGDSCPVVGTADIAPIPSRACDRLASNITQGRQSRQCWIERTIEPVDRCHGSFSYPFEMGASIARWKPAQKSGCAQQPGIGRVPSCKNFVRRFDPVLAIFFIELSKIASLLHHLGERGSTLIEQHHGQRLARVCVKELLYCFTGAADRVGHFRGRCSEACEGSECLDGVACHQDHRRIGGCARQGLQGFVQTRTG